MALPSGQPGGSFAFRDPPSPQRRGAKSPSRLWRARVGRGEIAVAVNQAPLAVLSSVDLRNPQPLASHRRPVQDHVTDLVADRVRQIGPFVHDFVFGGDRSFAEAAGHPVDGLLDLMPALLAGTEGAEQ